MDVITISETWLNSTVTNAEVSIDGYKLFRQDRSRKRGGGVCAFIREDIKVTILKDISQVSLCHFQQLWLKLQSKKLKSVVICVSYRPPDCPLSCFEDLLKPNFIHSLTLNKPIVILGDLNCNVLTDNPENKALASFMSDVNLKQVITTPTRITESSSSLIDVIMVSHPDIIYENGVINTTISDHLPVFVRLNLKIPRPPPCYITVRSYANYDPVNFSTDLASKAPELLTIFDEFDVNTKLSIFNKVFQSTLPDHAPIKTIKVRSRPCPYVTHEIKELMKYRNSLHRTYLNTRRSNDWTNFKETCDLVKATLVSAEQDYIRSEVEDNKNNPSSLWKVIKSRVPSKNRAPQVYNKDPKVLVEEFNHFFTSVGKNTADSASTIASTINASMQPDPSLLSPNSSVADSTTITFSFQPVSCNEVKRIILTLPSNKSPGFDKVTTKVIRDSLPVILGPLTDIINCSFITSTFPDEWKITEVIPLLKDGDKDQPANNRPLSLLVGASKICEKIALNQFISFLENSNKLTPYQSGNRQSHSTETLNISVNDMILEAMDKKMISALVLLDLSKAFDSINHQLLLQKLNYVGASHSAVSWFRSYLYGRAQSVRIGSTISSRLPITHGVPQGAIFSPILFCIYLSDLPTINRRCHLESYVDDSKLLLSFPVKDIDSAKATIEQDLHRVAKWCSLNDLLINPTKTKLLLVGTRQMTNSLPTDFKLDFLGKQITPSSSGKDLGVVIDSHLTYDDHIDSIVSSCMGKLCQISRVKDSFDKDTLCLMVSSLVTSKLFYCSSVWSNTSSKNVKKLQAVQNFASRIVSNTRKFDHITPAMEELEWLPIKDLLLYRDTIMTYKCIHGMAPYYLTSKFCNRASIHGRKTRNCDQLQIPLYTSAAGQRSFKFRGAKIWNSLDTDLKEHKSLKNFKLALKSRLFSNLYR